MNESEKMGILLGVLEQDRKHVLLYAVFCFSVPMFTIGNLDFSHMNFYAKTFLSISLITFTFGGLSYFKYAQAIHWHKLKAIRESLGNTTKAKEIMMGKEKGVWATSSAYWYRGKWFLYTGALCYIIFFIIFIYTPELFKQY